MAACAGDHLDFIAKLGEPPVVLVVGEPLGGGDQPVLCIVLASTGLKSVRGERINVVRDYQPVSVLFQPLLPHRNPPSCPER